MSERANANKVAATFSINVIIIIISSSSSGNIVRSHVCGMATMKLLLQSSGVWSRGLAKSASLCSEDYKVKVG